MEEMRRKFEEELVKWWPHAEGNMVRDGDDYANQFMSYAWWGWKTSRAALVVELPAKITEANKEQSGTVLLEVAAYDEAIDDCAEAIKAAGITIKGESND